MKTRMSLGQIDFIFLNPFNGIDVEIPDELYEKYRQSCMQITLLQAELQEILMPQCKAIDEASDRWSAQEGFVIQNIPKPGDTN